MYFRVFILGALVLGPAYSMTWEVGPKISKSFKSTSENASMADAGAYELCTDYLNLYPDEEWQSLCSKKGSASQAYCQLSDSVSSFDGEITVWYKVACR